MYSVEDRKSEIMQTCGDMSDALVWMKRFGRSGYVIRNLQTCRILAKHPTGFQGSTYRFMKDAEVENGNGKLHELCKGAADRRDRHAPASSDRVSPE
jgi:hypothetical protein